MASSAPSQAWNRASNGVGVVMAIAPAALSAISLLARAPHRDARLALGVLARDVLALVSLGLAATERDLDLRLAALEVDAHGNERVAAVLELALELVDLAAVEEQLAT